jgi:hypothetical protein
VRSAKQARTRRRLRCILVALASISLTTMVLSAPAGAAPSEPAWAISTDLTSPTNFTPGDSSGANVYVVQATNIGSEETDGSPITITDVLPPGLTLNPSPAIGEPFYALHDRNLSFPCEVGPPAQCIISTTLHPGERLMMFVPVNVAPDAPPTVTNQVSVSGGGAPGASDSVQTRVSPESAPFAVQSFTYSLLGPGGAPEARAGSHPYQLRIAAQFNTNNNPGGLPIENPRKITADLPAGLVINPKATPVRCTEAQLETVTESGGNACPDASAVGIVRPTLNLKGAVGTAVSTTGEPLYNMVPSAGKPAEFAFNAAGLGIFIHLVGRVRSDGDYGLSSDTFDAPQRGDVSGVSVDLWGDPSDPSHDHKRGNCAYGSSFGIEGACPVPANDTPLITMPSACSGPLTAGFGANSWQHPDAFVSKSAKTEDAAGNPVGVTGCDKLPYNPRAKGGPTTERAESGSGFDFTVDFENVGLDKKTALTESSTEKAIVTLPEGLTINPSVGEGLGFCRPDQFKAETAFSVLGEGCPGDSQVGTLHLTTPLLDEALDGNVFLAQQDDPTTSTPGAENPFDTDIALYMVLKNATRGVLVKQALKVMPDPVTGQLVATLKDIPQLPFTHFEFHFKEGARAALITPPRCGTYTTDAKLFPYSDPANPRTLLSSFEISNGVGGGPCPSGGVPPFKPFFEAGALNNSAASFSPFVMKLLRGDGEQDMTKFSSILPPGELGSLAGVSKCPDAAIALAKTKTGRQEHNSPSCPANSLIGHTLAGAGVGEALTYVPGNIYLAGPYKGDPLSVVSITPGLAGPFDAGTVVVRLALTLNPKTAEVEVDGAASDPIPHILKGIILKVRDLRVYVDRPNFTLNPTSCEPMSVKATLFGSFLDVFSPADDAPAALSTRYQAADCQSLGYRPRLSLNLKGGAKRGGHPALLASFKPRVGDANTKGLVVRLPRSAFLDQGHIRTICTRVQFAEKACPKAAQYGFIKAWTPLLDDPLEGPVYLRSSNHKLPDLLFDLHGLVDVEVATRIDSARGGIRATVESAPDAPISKVELRMQGGKKGLIVNSRNLCSAPSRANVQMEGHNGKRSVAKPLMRNGSCGAPKKRGQ